MERFSKLTRYQKRHMVVGNDEQYYIKYLENIAKKLHILDNETYTLTYYDDLKKVYSKKGFKAVKRYAKKLWRQKMLKRYKGKWYRRQLFKFVLWLNCITPEIIRRQFGDKPILE